MRKKILIVSMLLLSVVATFAQAQLDNGQFEDWDDTSHATNWNSDVGGVFPTATRVTDAQSGTYAAKITTGDFFGQAYPGMIMLGDFNLTTFFPTGGTPFVGRPSSVSAYLKYSPVNQDSMMMFAYFTKWNPSTEHTDTIGATLFIGGETMTEYTKINFPVFYLSTETPDSVNIGFFASDLTMEPGSTLYIDSVSMEYGVQVLPTFALPATSVTSTDFNANWLPPLNAESFSIDVAYDEAFTDFVPGFEDADAGAGFSTSVSVPQQSNPVYYRVRVNYQGGETSFSSNVIEVTLPYPTVCFEATDTTYFSFIAKWEAVEAATGYSLDVSQDVNFGTNEPSYNRLLTGNVTEYFVTNLEMDTEYFYRIRANYGIQQSEPSNVISVITDMLVNRNTIEALETEIFAHKNIITIKLDNETDAKVEIYTTSGQLLSTHVSPLNNKIKISKIGVYIVKVSSSKGNYSKKVLITE